MKQQHIKNIYEQLDKFIRYCKGGSGVNYIRLKKEDYVLLVDSLSYYEKLRAQKKGHVEYRNFIVISEK